MVVVETVVVVVKLVIILEVSNNITVALMVAIQSKYDNTHHDILYSRKQFFVTI